MIKKLILLANALDKKGHAKEADFVDALIKRAYVNDDLPENLADINRMPVVLGNNLKFAKDALEHLLSNMGINKFRRPPIRGMDIPGNILIDPKPISMEKIEELDPEALVIWDSIQSANLNDKEIELIQRAFVIIDHLESENRIVENQVGIHYWMLDDNVKRIYAHNLIYSKPDEIRVVHKYTVLAIDDYIKELKDVAFKIKNKNLKHYLHSLIKKQEKALKLIKNMEEALSKKELAYSTFEEDRPCSFCAGRGQVPTGRPAWTTRGHNLNIDEMTWCPECEGEGFVTEYEREE